MSNKIDSSIIIQNTGRKFGADSSYVYCSIDGEDGAFTHAQLAIAKARAAINPEDMPRPSFWTRFIDWWH